MGSQSQANPVNQWLLSLWPNWLTPQGLTLARTPEERKAQAVERRFLYHGFQVPLLRMVALLLLAVMVMLHTDTGGASGLQRGLRYLIPALLYWSASFALVRLLYRRVEFLDLGRVVACLDVLPALLAIHVTGSGKSLLIPVLLIPISFLALTSFRVGLVSSMALPILYLSYMRLFGYSYVWGAEITKAFILLFSGIFLTISSLVVHSWRARLNQALDVSRSLIRQLEERGLELAESRVKAEQSSLAKSVFLSNMSHELRTPLNAILGYSQLLRRRNLEPDMEEQIKRIHRAGEHLLDLINDVLTISKIEAVGIVAASAPFVTANLFRSLEDMIRIRAHDKGIAFLMELQTPFPEQVLGDEHKLRQVLINLLGNAVKFTKQGEVRLLASYADGRARFSVEDTGPGLSSDEITTLFHRFSQTEHGRKTSEGTGLGLNISQAIVQAMGGEIRVESEVGHGARFSFEIPLSPNTLPVSDPPTSPSDTSAVLAPGQEPPRILVVDDREENRDLLVRILREAGVSAFAAEDGTAALQLVQVSRPDLVFLDIRMPGLDGFEVLAQLRKEETEHSLPRLPVVALTASVLDHEREAVMASGFDEYIRKPFKVWEITDCISRFLGLRFISAQAEPEKPLLDPAVSARSLPEAIRIGLLVAIEIGDLDEALKLLDAVEDQNAAGSLRDLAKKYRFETLKELLSQEPPC